MHADALEAHQFQVAVSYDDRPVVFAMRGHLCATTASELQSRLATVVDAGYRRLVLDFGEIESVDQAGVDAVAASAARVGTGMLTIRSASQSVRRLLDRAHISAVVAYEPSQNRDDSLGAEETPGDHSRAVEPPAYLTDADTLRALDRPTSWAALEAALGLIVAIAVRTVHGADGASVTLGRNGKYTTIAATDDTVRAMDRDQYVTGEGPCLSAAIEGHWFHVPSLSEEDRWPAFVPRAMQDGISAILSTPLMCPRRPVGALNIYSTTPRPFGPAEQDLAALLATQASGIVTNSGHGAPENPTRRTTATELPQAWPET